ncbi:site-specific integrase [Bradyrhizobium cajani]|uniref:site-specific integrase n=1 Tax=Bradyrhizobium cajani TaxID=1928661 RepID=UPI002810A419|nr:site-specific integrase [Bradyrhizobium cajani]
MTPIAPLITSFMREHMPQQRGYSPHSCDTCAYSFQLLFAFAFAAQRLHTRPSLLKLEQIDADMVVAFLHQIEHDRGNSPATRNLRLAAIKSFMRYVELRHPSALEQVAQINAIPGERHDQKLIRHLTMDISAPCSMLPTRRHASDYGIGRCCICASPAACASPS